MYLADIVESMELILQYTENKSEADFEKDTALQDMLCRRLEIIGEATKKVSEQTRDQFPEIPWRGMAGMRDRLIHYYHGIDLQEVWQVATVRIPSLLPNLIELLKDFKETP